MRVSFVFVILFFICLCYDKAESKATMDQIQGLVSKLKGSCIKKAGVSGDLVEGTHSGQFPADPALQCYFQCIMQMMNVVKSNKLSVGSLSKQINAMMEADMANKMIEIAQSCIQQATSEDLCEASWQFAKCWYETDSSSYMFP